MASENLVDEEASFYFERFWHLLCHEKKFKQLIHIYVLSMNLLI